MAMDDDEDFPMEPLDDPVARRIEALAVLFANLPPAISAKMGKQAMEFVEAVTTSIRRDSTILEFKVIDGDKSEEREERGPFAKR